MKVSATLLCTASLAATTTMAFSFQRVQNQRPQTVSLATEPVSRREAVLSSFTVSAWLGVVTAYTKVAPSRADIDYSKVQDLLGAPEPQFKVYDAKSGPRPTYLTEPTQEFKDNEEKAAAFKRGQLQQKREFLTALEKLESDPNEEGKLASDLDEMRMLVKKFGGLPLGVTKEELVKRVRRRKAKKYWPVNVEIAYVHVHA